MSSPSVRVGVGVIIVRDNQVLLGLRAGAHGAGTWALPGGHLEFGESPEDCAVREALEETGLAVTPTRRAGFTSDVFASEGRHYLTVFIEADSASGAPEVLEPTKCERWDWFGWSALPAPLFAPLASLVASGYAPRGER
jgi:8-oxo-dGTP diphosphatase